MTSAPQRPATTQELVADAMALLDALPDVDARAVVDSLTRS